MGLHRQFVSDLKLIHRFYEKKHSKPPSYQIVIQKIGHLVAGLHEFQ